MILPWRRLQPDPVVPGPDITTSLTQNETWWLRNDVAARSSPRVLEIGAAYGFSTVVMALAGARVTSVDPHVTHQSLPSLRANLREYGVQEQVLIVPTTSREAAALDLGDEPFDLAFVDGDHTAPGVRHDASWCQRLVRPGGLIAFHDYGEQTCPDVKVILDELYPAGPLQLVDTLFCVLA